MPPASVQLPLPSLPGWTASLSAGPRDGWDWSLPPGSLVLDLLHGLACSGLPGSSGLRVSLAWSPAWGWRPLDRAGDRSFPTSSLAGALVALRLDPCLASLLASDLPAFGPPLELAISVMGS